MDPKPGTSVCQNCGLVDPETNTEQSNGDNKADGSNTPVQTETTSPNVAWVNDVSVKDSSDENIVELLLSLDGAAQQLRFSRNNRIRAAELVIAGWENRLLHGRSQDALVGACVYLASRESERPVPVSIVAKVVDEREGLISNSYRDLMRTLELEIPVAGPEAYAQYLGEELGIQDGLVREVENVLDREVDISGNPAGIAVGALYLIATAHGHDITLVEAGKAAGVAKETVWRKVSDLRELEVCEGHLIRS
ncbi:transcription initiation factor IIB family protein [Natrarchaeobius chitinivorans]|uniref:Transcription initiation factor IIB n=1 Tax=Natrarchaeobius chitinivorans TaxID=1679083 RepID=A0A3N6LV98_NATCH|nr:transcription initiation factor IIB family protein [Natrarchaeobius chitinivorans]RQG94328.1 transcription initiation factor IIB family protein [Natrarchaeobius chitinivorans]